MSASVHFGLMRSCDFTEGNTSGLYGSDFGLRFHGCVFRACAVNRFLIALTVISGSQSTGLEVEWQDSSRGPMAAVCSRAEVRPFLRVTLRVLSFSSTTSDPVLTKQTARDGCTPRGPGFDHPRDSSQLSLAPVPGDPYGTQTYIEAKYPYSQNKTWGKKRGNQTNQL